MQQVNKRENQNPIVSKIDNIVMSHSEQLLKDLENEVLDLSGVMSILQDRVVQSNELSHALAFAKLGELKLQALKQKNDILKNLTSYKSAENAGVRKGPGELSISDLLNSAALGAGMGAKLNMSGAIANQPKIIDSYGQESNVVDIEVETVKTNLDSPESVADTLMKDFK